MHDKLRALSTEEAITRRTTIVDIKELVDEETPANQVEDAKSEPVEEEKEEKSAYG